MTDLYYRIEEAELERDEREKSLTESKAKLNELYRERNRQKPFILCEDNLLPYGPVCPACGLERAASAAIDGWVHHPTHALSRKELVAALTGHDDAKEKILKQLLM